MTIEITYRDQATGQPTGHPSPFRDVRPGEEVVIVISGPPPPPDPSLPPPESCHECCPPGEPCPCDARGEPFCECNHKDAAVGALGFATPGGCAECPGCAVALAPGAAHADRCEWLIAVKAGVRAFREGRITPWSDVKRELGIDATLNDSPPQEDAPAEHLHDCPTCMRMFSCGEQHATTVLSDAVRARLHHPAPGIDRDVEQRRGADDGIAIQIPPYWCAACLQGFHTQCAEGACRCDFDAYAEEDTGEATRPARDCIGLGCVDPRCEHLAHVCEACIPGGHRHCAQGACHWEPTPAPEPVVLAGHRCPTRACASQAHWCSACLGGQHHLCEQGGCRCEVTPAVPACATDDEPDDLHPNW